MEMDLYSGLPELGFITDVANAIQDWARQVEGHQTSMQMRISA
jgi:hypothetical protein